MNEEDEIGDSIDLARLLENDEELLQDEMNHDENQLDFDHLFDDDSIKTNYKADPDMALDPFLMTSESSFSDLLPNQNEGELSNVTTTHPLEIFHSAPPAALNQSQPLVHNQSQTQMRIQPQMQVHSQPRTASHEHFNTWPSQEQQLNRMNHYSRQSPYSSVPPAPPVPIMQSKTFEQHFEDRKQNLWKSMQNSAISKANINQMRKANRRHSMSSIDKSKGASNVDNSRQQLQASFTAATPCLNRHVRAPRRVSMDMYQRQTYRPQMNRPYSGGNFVQQPQHPYPYRNSVEHMNTIDQGSVHMKPPKAFRRSSWHGGQTYVPNQLQAITAGNPVPATIQYPHPP